jgi:hypothetical protein
MVPGAMGGGLIVRPATGSESLLGGIRPES